MLDMTDDQKKLFYTGGVFKDYTMSFDDIGLVITNDTLHQEAVTIKESIIEDNEFVLGGCIASSIEFEVSEIIDYDLNGLEFTVNLALSDGNVVIPMGKYRVNSAKRVDDKDYKRVIGYDALYDASIDVSSWYADYFSNGATHTVKETREALLTYLKIPFVEQNLTNDDEMLEKTIETTSMAGTDVLRALCVINGGFGHMNREGKFEVICLTGFGLFPEDRFGENENVYPSETLYPEDYFEYFGMSDNENACPEYRSCKYEEYMTAPITCLNIQSTTDDVGVTVGDDLSNPYVITANLFLYGKSQEELSEIGQNILGRIHGVTYHPNATELDGLPYLECGDAFSLYKNNDSVESYIFSRTLSGIQALKDTYEAKGNYIRANEVSANDEIIQLKGKSLEIKKSVEGLSIEVKDFENNTASKFEQTDEAISAEVTRATNAESSLSSRISMTADEISAEVTRATSAENSLSSRISITENGISQKVSKGDVCSEINQSAEQITLNSNRLVVNSSNFSLDSSGNGKIGGWNFGNGYMYSDGESFISTHSYTNYYQWNGFPYKSSLYQGKIICGVQTGATSEGIPTTGYGYCDLSVAGFYSKDKAMSNGYLFAVDVGNSAVTTNTGAFTASDRRLKKNITEIDEQYANNLIDGLKPSTYTMVDGRRTHSGFIADEVKMTAEKILGTVDDFAAYATVQIDEDKQDYAALRYEEFIAPLTKYCQCLKRDLKQEIEKNQQLQFQLLNLKGEFMILKQQILGGN